MKWLTGHMQRITVAGASLECCCWGPAPVDAPTIVMLHEGLGSVGLWKDFPQKLAKQTGCGVFAYSRAGYGGSDPVNLPRPLDFMTREAMEVLPGVLDAIGLKKGILLGHSDGASIAAIYLGSVADFRIRGLCLIAPHFFTEPLGLASIKAAKVAYETGNLRARLAKHHADPDNAFYGWNDTWLHPGFKDWNIAENIAYFRIPVLAIQGRDDQYGTLAQIDALRDGLYAPLDEEIIKGCKHAPHLEKQDAVLAIISDYIAHLDRIEAVDAEIR